MSSKRIETVATVVIAASTLVIAAVVVRNEVGSSRAPRATPNQAAVYLDGWEAYMDNGEDRNDIHELGKVFHTYRGILGRVYRWV